MGYCKTKDVLDMIKGDMIDVIIGNDPIEDSELRQNKIQELAETAISDADAEINGYINKRYNIPLLTTPEVISKFSKDIAVYNLVSRAGIDEGERESIFLTRYKSAIKYLEDVAKGIVNLGIKENNSTQAANSGFVMKSSTRIFSRESMRGW